MRADRIIGRRVVDAVEADDRVTLVLDDGTHFRLSVDEYDGGPIEVRVLDRVERMGEVIDRRVAEFEAKVNAARNAARAEEQRIVRERMERLLRPAAYREWLKRHQPMYIMNRVLRDTWTSEHLVDQLYVGNIFTVPLVSS